MNLPSLVETSTEIVKNIDKIERMISGFLPFFGVQRKAIDVYIAEIEKSDLSPELKLLTISNINKIKKELKNQFSVVEMALKRAKKETDFSKNSKVDDDWLARFMDSVKLVSNEQMQDMWGRILLGEFENPNSTPTQMIRILSEIQLIHVEVFTNVCKLLTHISVDGRKTIYEVPFVNIKDNFYNDLSLSFEELSELQNYGLIELGSAERFIKIKKSVGIELSEIHITYGCNCLIITDYSDEEFPIGYVTLTNSGRCLSKIIKSDIKEPVFFEEHFYRLKEYLKKKNIQMRV